MAKVVFTLLWAGVLIAANKSLDNITWAQYLATFLLGGIYAVALSKVKILSNRQPEKYSK